MSEQILNKILEKITSMEQGQKEIRSDIQDLKVNISNIEGQLTETNQIVHALLHRTEELDAKYDGLLNITASKDSIETLKNHMDERLDSIQTDLSYILGKVAQHDRNFIQLKQAK